MKLKNRKEKQINEQVEGQNNVKLEFFEREGTSKSVHKALDGIKKDIEKFLSFYPEAQVIDIKFNITYKNNDTEILCVCLLMYKI
jgi:hypothetical protein